MAEDFDPRRYNDEAYVPPAVLTGADDVREPGSRFLSVRAACVEVLGGDELGEAKSPSGRSCVLGFQRSEDDWTLRICITQKNARQLLQALTQWDELTRRLTESN